MEPNDDVSDMNVHKTNNKMFGRLDVIQKFQLKRIHFSCFLPLFSLIKMELLVACTTKYEMCMIMQFFHAESQLAVGI